MSKNHNFTEAEIAMLADGDYEHAFDLFARANGVTYTIDTDSRQIDAVCVYGSDKAIPVDDNGDSLAPEPWTEAGYWFLRYCAKCE